MLEPHHALAGLGEREHGRIAIVRVAGRTLAGVADQHLPRLAASEVENIRSDEIVDHDHVGRLQGAHGAQREQFGVARARSDERDAASLGKPRFVQTRLKAIFERHHQLDALE